MKKIEGNKLVALLISAGMMTTLLAACSVDTDELGKGINELGNAFITETEAPKPTETEASSEEVTEETETEVTQETEPDATPTATPTATPSPTPLPQRVDFSDYTEDILADSFVVAVEDFQESTYADGEDDELFATFSGNRLVVTEAPSENVRDSINIFVDGFYAEAEGAYARVVAAATTEYKLSGVIEEPYAVTVEFDYTTNSRVLSVFMRYDVTGGDEDITVIDFASFDMLSGQFITVDAITTDSDAFMKDLTNEFVSALEDQLEEEEPAETTVEEDDEDEDEDVDVDVDVEVDEDETEETEETTAATTTATETTAAEPVVIPAARDFDEIFVAPGPAAEDEDSMGSVTVYGIADGKLYVAVVDIEEAGLDEYLNRYGKSVLI